jgi:hypothetical protein
VTAPGGLILEVESEAIELLAEGETFVEVEVQTLVLEEPAPDVIADFGSSPGLSAFQLAVQQGFDGTLDEWLDSLVGATGTVGNFVYSQNSPALVAVVFHNLGFRPAGVRCYEGDEGGLRETDGLVTYINDNALTVTFLEPFSGVIYVS